MGWALEKHAGVSSLSVERIERLPRFTYRRAMPQQEKGGCTWCVATEVTKYADGRVKKTIYEPRLPTKERAQSVARVLNLALC